MASKNLEDVLARIKYSYPKPEYERFIPSSEECEIDRIIMLGNYSLYDAYNDKIVIDELTMAFSSIEGVANELLRQIAARAKFKLLPESNMEPDEQWEAMFKRLGGKSAKHFYDQDEPELFDVLPPSEYFTVAKRCNVCGHISALPYYQTEDRLSKVFITYKALKENLCIKCKAVKGEDNYYTLYISREMADDADFKLLYETYGVRFSLF
ncbi:MAG: hypothetical protein M1433_01395 [Candidatus Parvarchaeota archaeon]|nr:hypothetical protein [Candidatus Parvarchaeota archaeon]